MSKKKSQLLYRVSDFIKNGSGWEYTILSPAGDNDVKCFSSRRTLNELEKEVDKILDRLNSNGFVNGEIAVLKRGLQVTQQENRQWLSKQKF